jgi:LCP family protein required for cell wall assembly
MRDRGSRPQADRFSGMVRSVRTRERKHMRRRWQWVALGVVVVLAAAAGGALWLYVDTSNRIQTEIDQVQPPPDEGEPFNVLLVGSDSRAGLTEKEQEDLAADDETPAGAITGERADTLIVAHVDPATDRITMVQFPRDLWVPVVGRGRDRINSALLEGKGALVETVERLTGLGINRYVQVNIAGFRDLVDAIDGVDVCVPEPIPFDPSTGLEVEKPGMVHFDGDRALRFVRSRKAFGTGDLARIQNQQKFLSAAIDKITSVGTLINPVRIRALIQTAGENLRIDDRTSLPDLYRIGQRLKTFDPDRYEAYTVPNEGISESPVILPDPGAMKVLFEAIEANESPAEADGVPSIAPAAIDVAVLNGTFEDGAARAAARDLATATDVGGGPVSIDDAHIANAGRFDYVRSVIRFSAEEPEAERKARLVAAAVPGARVVGGRTPFGVDVAVVVGRRFRTRPIVQVVPIPIPRPGALPRVCRQG